MIGPHGDAAETATGDPQCSRAGCRASASWLIAWRNPRIHAEGRRKTWVACDAHVDDLRLFLAARDFPLDVSPLGTARESAR